MDHFIAIGSISLTFYLCWLAGYKIRLNHIVLSITAGIIGSIFSFMLWIIARTLVDEISYGYIASGDKGLVYILYFIPGPAVFAIAYLLGYAKK